MSDKTRKFVIAICGFLSPVYGWIEQGQILEIGADISADDAEAFTSRNVVKETTKTGEVERFPADDEQVEPEIDIETTEKGE